MRTKTLLIAAAALVAGIVSSEAQTVYSANVVGYINVTLTNGFISFANQLDFDGTGTNNTVVTVFGTNLQAGSVVEAWNPIAVGFTAANWINSKGTLKWTGDTNSVNAALNEGGGVFISSPVVTNVVVVGTVIQGTNIVHLIPGFNLASAVPPLSGTIDTNLNYAPTVGDLVEVWNVGAQNFTGFNYINSKGTLKWSPSDPVIGTGIPVFISTASTPGWTNGFVVQ